MARRYGADGDRCRSDRGGAGAFRIAHDASGKFVYVVNVFSNNVSAFTINAADGSLTPAPGSPFAVGVNPRSTAVSGWVQ